MDRNYTAESEEIHHQNLTGSHDEMPTREDCPGCAKRDEAYRRARAAQAKWDAQAALEVANVGAKFTPQLDPTTSGHSYLEEREAK